MPETSERIAELRRELESNPASRQFYQLGELLRRAGRAAEAASVLRAGLGHHPRYVAAWVSLGRACLDRSRPSEAARALHEALELDAHNPVAWRLLGEARLGDGDRFGALDAMQHALQLAPGDEVLRAAVDALASETWPPAVPGKPARAEAAEALPRPGAVPADDAAAVEVLGAPPPVEVTAAPRISPAEPSAETPPARPPSVAPVAPPARPAAASDLDDPFAVAPPSAAAAAVADVFAAPVEAETFADEPFGRAPSPVSAQAAQLADVFEPPPAALPVAAPAPPAPAAFAVPRADVAPPLRAPVEGAPALDEVVLEPFAEPAEAATVAETGPLATPEEALPLPAADLVATSAFAAAALEPAFAPEAEPPVADHPGLEAAPPAAEPERAGEAEPAPPARFGMVEEAEAALAPAAVLSLPPVPATRPTVTLARLYLQQQDFPAAIAILERVVSTDPDNQEASDLLDLVHDMMAPLPGELPSLSVRERKIAALQGWLASLTLGQERMAR